LRIYVFIGNIYAITLEASKIIHKGETRILVKFPYNLEIASILRQIPSARWSQTHRGWHIAYHYQAFRQLSQLFPDIVIIKNDNDAIAAKSSEETNKQHVANVAIEPIPSSEQNKKIDQPKQEDFGVKKETMPPEVKGNQKLNSVPKAEKELSPSGNMGGNVMIEVYPKIIIIKLPKNEIDIRFITTTFRYTRWDKNTFSWVVPNYKNNIELIKSFFRERIGDIKIHADPKEAIKKSLPGTNEIQIIDNGSGRLKLIARYNKELLIFLRSVPFSKFNKDNNWWSIPNSELVIKNVKEKAEELKLNMVYINEAKGVKKPRISNLDVPNYRPCPESMILKLRELRYSEASIRSYKHLFEELINYHYTKDIDTISEPEIIQFCRYLVMERGVSSSTQNQAINAIKFYFEKVLGGQRKFYMLERPIKEQTLPEVLSEDEVKRILKATPNLKHRTILTVIYSAGLRISEAVNLKIKDIDSQRMQIRVEQSKGKKDRYTILSKKTLELLREYFKKYRPTEYLFEGMSGQYSKRSIQAFYQRSVESAGILKEVTVHTLRHSFATHMLENGTDIRYIQVLLGHASSKTTEIYTHVTTKGFDQLKSPFDNFDI
jgi:integrase/recombinase XerD